MNWDAIGAVGEILGAIAVFLTLAYLAIQIRQNTKAVQASAVDSGISTVSSVRQAMFESAELTDIYIKGSAEPDSLSKAEKIRYRLLVHNILMAESNIHAQALMTGLSNSTWVTQLPIIARQVSSPGGKWFWEEYKMEFEESFRAEVDKIIDTLE